MRLALALAAALLLSPAHAQEEYGAKGMYPVYETGGQWLIFDKNHKKPKRGEAEPLALGARMLVVGSQGAEVFTIARTSGTYGGACRKNRPAKLDAALLKGPRDQVGSPIIAVKVPESFTLTGSRATYMALGNEVNEATYARLGKAVKDATVADIKSGAFHFALDDSPNPQLLLSPKPEQIQMKMDFGARVRVRGLGDAFALVETSQVLSTFRRCLRLADDDKLVGPCAPMPHALLAETGQLKFVAYDPGGQGSPLLLAYTPAHPLWGDERWAFSLRSSGPRLFLFDAMDPRCREGF